jgi:hypothetical protein
MSYYFPPFLFLLFWSLPSSNYHVAFRDSIPLARGIFAKENHLLAFIGIKWLSGGFDYLCDNVLITSLEDYCLGQ